MHSLRLPVNLVLGDDPLKVLESIALKNVQQDAEDKCLTDISNLATDQFKEELRNRGIK